MFHRLLRLSPCQPSRESTSFWMVGASPQRIATAIPLIQLAHALTFLWRIFRKSLLDIASCTSTRLEPTGHAGTGLDYRNTISRESFPRVCILDCYGTGILLRKTVHVVKKLQEIVLHEHRPWNSELCIVSPRRSTAFLRPDGYRN